MAEEGVTMLKKCSKCSSTMLQQGNFDKNRKGEWFKTCNRCRSGVRPRKRQSPDFSKGKIYAIKSHKISDVYIGSTTRDLEKRLGIHKDHYKLFKKGVRSTQISSFSILEHGDAYIQLVELFPCNDRKSLERREGQIIKTTPNCVNKIVVGRTVAECRSDNKEHYDQYRKDNAEKIKQQRHDNYVKNIDEIKKKSKQYRDTHKAEIKERDAKYRMKNLEKLKAFYSEKTKCGCGGSYDRSSKAKHERTNKHKLYESKN
jgi:GIY-YIG catalytic domain